MALTSPDLDWLASHDAIRLGIFISLPLNPPHQSPPHSHLAQKRSRGPPATVSIGLSITTPIKQVCRFLLFHPSPIVPLPHPPSSRGLDLLANRDSIQSGMFISFFPSLYLPSFTIAAFRRSPLCSKTTTWLPPATGSIVRSIVILIKWVYRFLLFSTPLASLPNYHPPAFPLWPGNGRISPTSHSLNSPVDCDRYVGFRFYLPTTVTQR